MAYVRLFRRVRVAPGIMLNLAKRGPSLSFGVRGGHVTVGKSGVRKTVGLPGTGVFVTSEHGWHSGVHTGQTFHDAAPPLSGWESAVHAICAAFLVLVIIAVGLAFVFALLGV
ncbi:MAG TPA: DUF4236 domain-containing protein [Terriglobia bacterium]|nr:DUF4236 domain-containing protein [Terriglobia bacterium]